MYFKMFFGRQAEKGKELEQIKDNKIFCGQAIPKKKKKKAR